MKMHRMSIPRTRTSGRICLALATSAAVSACSAWAPQEQPLAAAPAAVFYDGHYAGTVRSTGASGGMRQSDCETPSPIAIDVRDNRFSLAQPHPAAAASTPSLQDKTTPVYNATIASDGTIKGVSEQTNATLEGRISSGQMNGQIYGLLCYYEFTAERI
jgi:hypothetical protein